MAGAVASTLAAPAGRGFHLRPGVGVAVQRPQASDAPRMDVALFLGLAEKGPLHRPVIIDSPAAFASVFGGPAPLAMQADGTVATTLLAGTVAAFFAAGGTRCHVVRLARSAELARLLGDDPDGDDVARPCRFALPGLMLGGQPLVLRAASPGSWADRLLVAARIERSLGRPRLLLRVDAGSQRLVFGPHGLSPADPDSLWALVDDDTWFDAPDAPVAPRPWLLPEGPPGAISLAGLGEAWSEPVAALPDARDPLERDGLSRLDDAMFIDPRLALTPADNLAATARALREVAGARLFGLGAAFAVAGDGDLGEPSLIALPDLAHAGWQRRVAPPLTAPALPAPVPATAGFGTCAPPLPAPLFIQPATPRLPGRIDLNWTMAEPGCHFRLDLAYAADFRDAVMVWESDETGHSLTLTGDGPHYFRLTATKGGRSSTAATAVMVMASQWEVAVPANPVAADARAARLRARHMALLATAAAAEQFALASLPADWRAAEAVAHAAALRAAFAASPRPLSFAALHHPWPVAADASALPPDGAIAGTLAAAARRIGAWAGQAGITLPGTVALTPALPDSVQERLADAGINLLKVAPRGFMAADLLTLSPDRDWRFIGSRRLIMLLRRQLLRLGREIVFEPWGDTLERTLDRRLSQLLDDLFRRGALAGDGGATSRRLMIAAPGSRRDDGELVIEVAVAPQQPLRFLQVVLTRSGGALALGGA